MQFFSHQSASILRRGLISFSCIDPSYANLLLAIYAEGFADGDLLVDAVFCKHPEFFASGFEHSLCVQSSAGDVVEEVYHVVVDVIDLVSAHVVPSVLVDDVVFLELSP